MARFKQYDYSQKVFIPVSVEDKLMPGNLKLVIRTLVEKWLGMSVFRIDITMTRPGDPHIIQRY